MNNSIGVATAALALLAVGCGGHSSGSAPFSTAAPATSATTPTTPNPTRPRTPPPPPPPTNTTIVSGWLPYWTYTEGDQIIDANTGNGLDEVNTFGIGLQPDGTLTKRNGIEDPARIAAIRNRGGEVIPTIYDVHDGTALESVLANPTYRARAITEMLDLLDQGGYDGIDIDFEHAKSSNRDEFSTFVEDLSAEVRARGRVFSVTIPGKWRDLPSWPGYDYTRLAPAADRLKLMCYGWSGAWGPPGPIAPTHWIEDVLAYAIPIAGADKIQIGIPFYGTDWPDNGGTVRSRSYRACQALIAQSTTGVIFDAARGEAHFDYVDANGVNHTVWFSEERSVAAKAALVKQYGLRGLSVWALGYGDRPLWDAIRAEVKTP